jgi:hypothetical protein
VVVIAEHAANTPRGPSSTSSTLVVAATRLAASTPGDRHRRLQLRWWPLPEFLTTPRRGPPSKSLALVVAAARYAASTPRGPAVDVWLNLVPAARIFLATPTRGGGTAVNITTKSKATSRKSEGNKSFGKKIQVLVVPRTRESYYHYRS